MNIHLECFPCYYRQAIQAARLSGGDKALQWKAAHALSNYLATVESDTSSMIVAEQVHDLLKKTLNNPDPYLMVKEFYTEMAEKMEPMISDLATRGGDPLLTAVKISIAGNIIDFGAGGNFDVETAIRGALDFEFAVNHYDTFRTAVEKARTVLYLADNTGEIYFDKPLLRLLHEKEVTFVTRGGPSLNDATMEYAERAGIGELATLVDTGLASMMFPLTRIRPEVAELFRTADVVISKGQANFESLHEETRPSLFFLMKVKCDLVAKLLGEKHGDILIMESGRIQLNEV